jgi:hypothetical protein
MFLSDGKSLLPIERKIDVGKNVQKSELFVYFIQHFYQITA